LVLSGSNSLPISIASGTIKLGSANCMVSTGNGLNMLGSSATLDLNGHSPTVGSTSWGGNTEGVITNSAVGIAATLTIGNGDLDSQFGGTIEDGAGTLALNKIGNGRLMLYPGSGGTHTYTGPTVVSEGTLLVHAPCSLASVVTVTNATLSGDGTVGGVTAGSGGHVSPGTSPGVLNTGDVSLGSGSTFDAEIDSDGGPGVGHDLIDVTGTVDIDTGAGLVVALSYGPTPGTTYKVIDNDGVDAVNGSFSGLTEGTVFPVNGIGFSISYVGGDGNDVVLTVEFPDPVYVDDSWAGTASGVDPDGAGGPAGAFGYDAFATIDEGTDYVKENGTVYVYTGTYNESADINKAVTLTRADVGESPVMTGGGTGLSITVPGVVVNYITLQNYAVGVDVVAGGDAVVEYCGLVNCTVGVQKADAPDMDASPNWWGHVTGPGAPEHTGYGSGVGANVDFRPWWGDATGTVEYYYHVPAPPHANASIRDAVNSPLVPTGGGIIVDAGTYVEDVTIGKPVFIDAVTTFTVDGDVTFDAEPVLITGAVLADPGTADADDAWHVTTNGQIADACLAANTGETVWVQDGTHTLLRQAVIENKDINVFGVTDADTNIVDGNNQYRGFMLVNAAGTVIEDLTIQDCWADDGVAGPGGAIYSDEGGSIFFCNIYSSTATQGGGVYLEDGGTLRNCLFEANVATSAGGGVYMLDQGLIESCTIVGNSGVYYTTTYGGGVYLAGAGMVLNSIIYYNEAVVGENYVHAGAPTYSYSCTTPAVAGATNVSEEPYFRAAGDYTLEYWDVSLHLSPCLDVGSNQGWMTGEIDLLGEDRIINGTVDMGALECTYEDQPGAFEEPDFVVRRIILDPRRPAPGTTFTAYVQVKNMGRKPLAPGWIGVQTGSGGGVSEGWFRLRTLQVGESQTATFPQLTAGARPERVTIFLDTGDETEEESELNNTFSVPYPQ